MVASDGRARQMARGSPGHLRWYLHGRVRVLVMGLALATAGVTGCTTMVNSNSSGSQAADPNTPAPSAPVEPESPREPPQAPAPGQSGDPRRFIRECPGPVAAEARAAVRSQLAEFAQGRFKRARSYASDEFRANISLDEFRDIIEVDYPFLLENPRASFSGCVERDGKAYLQVALTTDTVTVLTYRLVRDPDNSLAIDAATISAVSLDAET